VWILYIRSTDERVDEKRYVDEGVKPAYELHGQSSILIPRYLLETYTGEFVSLSKVFRH